MNGITIYGTGSAVPENCLTNQDLTQMVDTSDEWITSRTGIKNRYISKSETTTSLATEAGKKALENSGIDPNEIGLLIVATFTPDNFTPSVACMVQRGLGLNHIPMMAFDINAACSGFIYALTAASAMLAAMPNCKYGLVIGSEVVSRVIDYKDRGTCILFGDGAGAVIVGRRENSRLLSYLDSKGDDDILCAKNAEGLKGSPKPLSMNGREVYQFAVEIIPESINSVLDRSGCSLKDVRYVICHQANERIIAAAENRLGAQPGQFVRNIEKYGNTSAASIPILLDELNRDNKLNRGDKIILVGFGGGLTWGAVMFEW
jgi:3-oxoacyl-[acyl-carrier-protein] synthase-3